MPGLPRKKTPCPVRICTRVSERRRPSALRVVCLCCSVLSGSGWVAGLARPTPRPHTRAGTHVVTRRAFAPCRRRAGTRLSHPLTCLFPPRWSLASSPMSFCWMLRIANRFHNSDAIIAPNGNGSAVAVGRRQIDLLPCRQPPAASQPSASSLRSPLSPPLPPSKLAIYSPNLRLRTAT